MAVKDDKKITDIGGNEKLASVSRTVQLDVVELLKQVLQWTPRYKPGLNRALLQAAKVGSVGCVKVLLSAGADVESEDENGDTAFVHAFRGRHIDVMRLLHESGCTAEIVKISLALATKDVALVKACYELDVPVENEDWISNDIAEVRILLEDLKLDPFEGMYGRHGFDDSPFLYVVQEGRAAILEEMCRLHSNPNKYSENDTVAMMNKALLKAVKYKRMDAVKILIENVKASIECTDEKNRTPLLIASGHDELIAFYLLDKNADVTAQDSDGLSSLHWAACAGFKTLCEILITEYVVDVDAGAKLGATPLMIACSGRHSDVVGLLLSQKGCNLNKTTPEGWTALHVAVRACAPNVVRQLLRSGADPNIESYSLEHNGDRVPASSPLLMAISVGSVRMVRHLFDANCDFNRKAHVRSNDTTNQKICIHPIAYAILSGAWDIADILIKFGCDLRPLTHHFDFRFKIEECLADDRKLQLRRLILHSISNPYKLSVLCRRVLRNLLGRNLLHNLDVLRVHQPTKFFILGYDLFKSHTDSFEV